MTEKPAYNKQSRHESAKTKYQHYQRVLSCKNLMKNVAPITPSPGQFIVENNKPLHLPTLNQSNSCTLLLTKNIRSIVQKSNPVPFNEMLSEVVLKKNIKTSAHNQRIKLKKETQTKNWADQRDSQPYFKRPISAKIYHETSGKEIQDSEMLKRAFELDRQAKKNEELVRKNYFQVKPKLKIPKHIHGYNTIVLEEKSGVESRSMEVDLLQNEVEKEFASLGHRYEKNFLPTQYYFTQNLKPDELIEKYKNENGVIFGFSKWFHNDGKSSWRRCRILKYNQTEQRWQIQWLGSGISKKVSRNNLYFENEDFNQFQKAVQAAEDFRKRTEIYMKYNILINLISSPTSNFSQLTEQRVRSRINFDIKQTARKEELTQYESQLIEDVKKLYARACHQFQFNLALPYSTTFKKIFGGVLPDEMFDPNPRKMMMDNSNKLETISRNECSEIFESGLKKIKEKCFLNSEKKIKILELINVMSEELSSVDLLKDYKKFEETSYSVQQVDAVISRNISEYLYKINCRICDIEHHVSKQLDPIYTNKKLIPEETYNSSMARYQKFLLLANMRIECLLRQSATNMIKNLLKALPTFRNCRVTNCSGPYNEDIIFLEQKVSLKIGAEVTIKEEKLQINPNPSELSKIMLKNVDKIVASLKNIKCISKTYLSEIRPSNLLQIVNPNYQSQEIEMLNNSIAELTAKMSTIEHNFSGYISSLTHQVGQIFELTAEITKKSQKKNSYTEIEQFIDKINQCESEVKKTIKIQEFNLCGIFQVNFEEIKTKISNKISEAMKCVVGLLLDKIYKDNEKMDKNVSSALETLLKVPNTISEFVELQAFVTDVVKQQIEKAQAKAKMLTQKMNLLEKTSQSIEYKQFESCCQIYLKPLKLKKAREQILSKLENVYKKNFAEELMKESFSVLDNIRTCEKMMVEIFENKTLEQMDSNFNLFSELSSTIQLSCQKMQTINDKENLLKWSKTNFDRLLEVKQQFEPYYKLITLHKNYRLNLLPLLEEAFTQINYQNINSNVTSSCQTLKYLQNHVFNGNAIYEPIIGSILIEYEQFSSFLPLIKALRNPDLRDRHWVIIENVTGVDNIRGDQITLKEILSEQITAQSPELFKISEIATKELIYQKSLNQLKREWRDVRISMREIKIGNQTFKFIRNLGEVEKKIENDMLEVNNILSSSFIKFLQSDVAHWKSSVLEKVYEFVNYWPGFENRIIFYLRLINSSKISEYFSNIQAVQKNFQKFFKQFINNVEYQSLIVDIVCSRTWESINSLEFQMEEIQRIISEFLEEKKKMNSKLRLFSDDALISMIIQSNSDNALESMKKCFSGAKSFKFIEQLGSQNIEIKSMLDQKIIVTIQEKASNGEIKSEKEMDLTISKEGEGKESYQFDELLFSIDRQLKKQIKTTFLSSLQHQIRLSDLLCQVQLLRCRLIFKNKIEQALTNSKNLGRYELEILEDQRQYIASIKNNPGNKAMVKVCSLHIMEIINQLNVVEKLNQIEDPLSSFEWYKYPKYELADVSTINNPKLKLVLGSYVREYLFELTECQSFVVNPLCDAIFLNICTALNDRMIPMMQGSHGSSRLMHLEYLGELMGRNVTHITCSSSTSSANLLQYLKIASSGLLLVLSQMQKLSRECISVFNQTLSTFWVNYQLSRANINSFSIGSEQFMLDVPNFTLIGIRSESKDMFNPGYFKQCFRTFALVPISSQFLLKSILLSAGVTQTNQQFVTNVLNIVRELNYEKFKGNLISINTNLFLYQISQQYLKQRSNSINYSRTENQLLEQSLQGVVEMYLPSAQNRTSPIWKNLLQLNLIRKNKDLLFKKIDIEGSNQPQKMVETNKALQNLKNLLQFHCGVIVTGPNLSGKSAIINSLLEQQEKVKYNFCSLNSLAYSVEELYEGNGQKSGIIRQIIDEIKVRASGFQLTAQVINGIYFDCQIGAWAEPLLSIINRPRASQISCSNGTLLTLPVPMKLIFETESLSDMAPSQFHSLGILSLSEQVTWRSILQNLFNKYFPNQFSQCQNAVFIKSLLEQTFDSILEFYQSIHRTKANFRVEPVILENPIILESFVRFFSLIYHKEDIRIFNQQELEASHQKQVEEKTKSEMFNIFTYSIVATLGLLIPEQSRKTFSRHFKYVLEQSHLGRYGWKKNNIFSKDDENIYDFVYENGEWKKWRNQRAIYSNDTLLFGQYKFLQIVLQYHIQLGSTCFLIGEECSSKNYIFKNYISELKVEKYTKNYFACSSLTKKLKISDKIQQMIHTEKYSRKINGFSNCKKNIFYVQDLNMAAVSDSFGENGSIVEFMKQFYRQGGWYINGNNYCFSNLSFYGTLNQNLKMPKKILRYLNPILMAQPENRVQSILEANIKSSPISSFQKELIIRCTLNLQDVIARDFTQSASQKDKQYAKSLFSLRDMVRVVRGVCKVTENVLSSSSMTMHSLLRFWVYIVDKVYSQKLNQKKSFLFYHINNVLMEQERVRYRTICPSSDFYIFAFRQSCKSLKNLRQTYETSTIEELATRIKRMSQGHQKYRYISVLPNETLCEMIKLMVRIANSFDFESKIVILINEQKRIISQILKMLGLASQSMIFQAFNIAINQEISAAEELSIERSLNHSFTKEYFLNFDQFQPTSSKLSSPFQSQLQSKNNIENEFDEMKSNQNKDKNRIVYHIKDIEQKVGPQARKKSNFILEDLLTFKKINKLPKWMIPKEESYEDIPQLSESSINNKRKMFQKYLSNRDSQEMYKEMQQKEQRCKNMDMNVILQFDRSPAYLLKYYMNLVHESSLLFLQNSAPEFAQVEKTNRIIMTDVKRDEEVEDQSDIIDLRQCSIKEINRLAAKHGDRIYIDLTLSVFQQYMESRWDCNLGEQPLSFKNSFRNMFNKLLNDRKQKNARNSQIEEHIRKNEISAKMMKEKLESERAELNFILNQNNLRLQQVTQKIEKQEEKYSGEKKKISQISEKIHKKQAEFEQNLQCYRQSMDKHSFQFSKVKEKLIKLVTQFETAKMNIANEMSVDNKLLMEALTCVLGLVDMKKNEDVAMIALRQFNKLLKEKKLAKLLSKASIETLSPKGLSRAQKILQQVELLNKKTQTPEQGNDINLKQSIVQFLEVSLIASKQFNSSKVKENYENLQSGSKLLQKLKAEQSKKQKSKAIKHLFENYHTLIQEKQKMEVTSKETSKKIEQIKEVVATLQAFLNVYLPKVAEQFRNQPQNQQTNENNPVITALCMRYFNQLYGLTQSELALVFESMEESLSGFNLPFAICGKQQVERLNESTAIDSIFSYRGCVLLQKAVSKYCPRSQSHSVVEELFFSNRNLKKVSPAEFLSSFQGHPQRLLSFDGLVIEVEQINQNQCLDVIEKITSEEGEGLIIIYASYFSEQQKCQYPYIDFVSGLGVRLDYQYIFNKCRAFIYDKHTKNMVISQGKEKINSQVSPNSKLLQKFMMLNIPSSTDLSTMGQCCSQLQQVFKSCRQISEEKQIQPEVEATQVETEPILTEKQKQKLFLENKVSEFFAKFYIIVQLLHRNGEKCSTSLQHYLEMAQKIVKSTPNYNIVTNPELTSYKYLSKIGQELEELGVPMHFTLLNLMINCKMNTFGNAKCYQRYLEQLIKQLCARSKCHEITIQLVKNAIEKLKSCVPSLVSAYEEISLDYQFWVEDVNAIYKEEREPPVQWLYLMLVAEPNRFWELLNKLERRAIEKHSADPDFFQGCLTQQRLHLALNTPRTGNLVTSVFISTQFCLHDIVTYIEKNRLEYQFLDIAKFVQKQKSLSALSSASQSRKSQKKAPSEIQFLFEGNKLIITFIQANELSYVTEFVELVNSQSQSKRSKNSQHQQLSQIKLIIISSSQQEPTLPPTKNTVSISHPVSQYHSLHAYSNEVLKYYSEIVKDKVKLREHEQLPARTKRSIYEIFMTVCETMIELSLSQRTHVSQALRRGLEIIQKISKTKNNGLKNEPIYNCKLALKQILYEYGPQQLAIIDSIIKRVEDQSGKIAEESSRSKYPTIIKESSTFKKIKKILVNRSIIRHTSCFKPNPVVSNSETLSSQYNMLHRQINNDSGSPLNASISELELDDFLYIFRRRQAQEMHRPLQSISVKLQLTPKSLCQPKSIILPSCVMRIPLSVQRHEFEDKLHVIQVEIVGESSGQKWSKAKGILLSHPLGRLHEIQIKQEIFLSNYITYGMGECSYLVDYNQDIMMNP